MHVIIISVSSDIGTALAETWSMKGWKVYGTYRTKTASLEALEARFELSLTQCDLTSYSSIERACSYLIQMCPSWDCLVFSPGTLDPIGPFEKALFDEWEKSIQVNFIQQMRILHSLLPTRSRHTMREPAVLLFAGGGINNAVINYSSYTLSKIALIKMCEYMDAEIPDIRFATVGTGWVRTKIHQATLQAGFERAGVNFLKTEEKFKRCDWIPIERVVNCCTWLATTTSKGIKGRNFSVADDLWGDPALEEALEKNPDMYKLRRHANLWGKNR
jgi:NAD(P)-dependent dehydrogenase (short-subunit alcohol dehydrogenase family)